MKENTFSEGTVDPVLVKHKPYMYRGLLKLVFTRANYYNNYIICTKHKTET